MCQVAEGNHTVWMKEAMHRAANLEHIAANWQRVAGRNRIGWSNPTETIKRASTLAKAYRSLHKLDHSGVCPCVDELKNIAYGLVAIFSHTVGPVMLSLNLQPVMLEPEQRRAVLLVASELVMNAMRHAFIGRQSGAIRVSLHWEEVREEGILAVADDGRGPDGITVRSGHGHGILRGLAAVLEGTITWRKSQLMGGTEAVLCFPVTTPALALAPASLE